MEEIKVRELPNKYSINSTDYIPIEDLDGTKKVQAKYFRTLVLNSLYFENIDALKNSSNTGLKEGDVCETLGYHTPGDGGGAKYKITYNPTAVEDGALVHYLSYSDTLRAELILGDTINVHQFGAVGDGKTDDTDAIQAAINHSTERIVEFTNNKTYVTRDAIKVHNSNTIINGNGAVLFPHYTNGIDIMPADDNSELVDDITIDKLNFDCSKATIAIYAYRSTNVNMVDLLVKNITSRGIELNNADFVNIEKCKFSCSNTGYPIVLKGTTGVVPASCRAINIRQCSFNNFDKAVYILSTGTTDATNVQVNIDNCEYNSSVSTSNGIFIACQVESVSINSSVVNTVNTFLCMSGASKGNVSCRDISCTNASYVFDIKTATGLLSLTGIISVSPKVVLFASMNGTLHSNIMWNMLPNGASFKTVPTGEIYDVIYPMQYREVGYSIDGSKLTLREFRNFIVDWSDSTNNLNRIANGVKGQLLYIKSSTNKSIIAVNNKILLSLPSIQLGPYNGILLRYDGLKWIQIDNTASTLTVLKNELAVLIPSVISDYILQSPSGAKFKLYVDNEGVLNTSETTKGTVTAITLESYPGDKKYRLSVDDNGVLITSETQYTDGLLEILTLKSPNETEFELFVDDYGILTTSKI